MLLRLGERKTQPTKNMRHYGCALTLRERPSGEHEDTKFRAARQEEDNHKMGDDVKVHLLGYVHHLSCRHPRRTLVDGGDALWRDQKEDSDNKSNKENRAKNGDR
uniref:Uncharacterized protein n=1 Tax=Steinernema glaseri TaxID=37863 RepID=A0A1I7YWM6_9BILA